MPYSTPDKRRMFHFCTKRFAISAFIEYDDNYRYNGDDEDAGTQRKLDSGEYVAFDTQVVIHFDGLKIADEWLCGNVYAFGEEDQFFSDHWRSEDLYRNCEAMRAKRGHNAVICHYFPSMVKEAVSQARKFLNNVPKLRAA